MSKWKLKKYLIRTLSPIIGEKLLTPVVLTDSKGYNLKDQASTPHELEIGWWCQPSLTTKKGLDWLQNNLAQEIGRLDNIHLCVWLGNCELTDHDGQFISLSSKENIVQEITDTYQEIIDLIKPYPACRITFLEIPPYLIIHYNHYYSH